MISREMVNRKLSVKFGIDPCSGSEQHTVSGRQATITDQE